MERRNYVLVANRELHYESRVEHLERIIDAAVTSLSRRDFLEPDTREVIRTIYEYSTTIAYIDAIAIERLGKSVDRDIMSGTSLFQERKGMIFSKIESEIAAEIVRRLVAKRLKELNAEKLAIEEEATRRVSGLYEGEEGEGI